MYKYIVRITNDVKETVITAKTFSVIDGHLHFVGLVHDNTIENERERTVAVFAPGQWLFVKMDC